MIGSKACCWTKTTLRNRTATITAFIPPRHGKWTHVWRRRRQSSKPKPERMPKQRRRLLLKPKQKLPLPRARAARYSRSSRNERPRGQNPGWTGHDRFILLHGLRWRKNLIRHLSI